MSPEHQAIEDVKRILERVALKQLSAFVAMRQIGALCITLQRLQWERNHA